MICPSVGSSVRFGQVSNLRQQQLQEEFLEHEAQLLSQASPEDRESLKSACVVCLSNFKSCVFLECGRGRS